MGNEIKEIYEQALERTKKADFITGFYDLDIFCKYIDGGDIITIGGRPAMGKTNFAVSLVNHLADYGKSIIYFSLSQSKFQFVQRLVAERIGTPLFPLLEGSVRKEEVDIVLTSFENKKLNIIDKPNLSVDDVETNIKELKPDIVFIDHIQLIQMPKAPNVTEAINYAIKELKRIALENNVIMIILSQLSRSVEARMDKRPMFTDLRNGSLLEELSDVILFLYREGYYNCEAENPCNEIIVPKNSMGPTGTVWLDFKHGFFRNLQRNDTF